MKKVLLILVLALPCLFFTLPSNKHQSNSLSVVELNDSLTYAQYQDLVAQEIENNKIPVLYYAAGWCPPCKKFKVLLEENETIKSKMKDLTIFVVDISYTKDCDEKLTKFSDIIYCKNNPRRVPQFCAVDKSGNSLNKITGSYWFTREPILIDEFLTAIKTGEDKAFKERE